jgi:hypothetical protein
MELEQKLAEKGRDIESLVEQLGNTRASRDHFCDWMTEIMKALGDLKAFCTPREAHEAIKRIVAERDQKIADLERRLRDQTTGVRQAIEAAQGAREAIDRLCRSLTTEEPAATKKVETPRKHVRKKCGCGERCNCVICAGGLFICEVCGGAEGSLPTECPGRPMCGWQIQAVLDGSLDFIDGKWIDKRTQPQKETTTDGSKDQPQHQTAPEDPHTSPFRHECSCSDCSCARQRTAETGPGNDL